MSFYSFTDIINSSKFLAKMQPHWVRSYFSEIIEFTNIDASLFKAAQIKKLHSSEQPLRYYSGRIIRDKDYAFPEYAKTFIPEIVSRFTSNSFQRIRKRHFFEAELSDLQYLIDGFCKMLRELGYSEDTIDLQHQYMANRMLYNSALYHRRFLDSISRYSQWEQQYLNNSVDYLLPGDQSLIMEYMVNKLNQLTEHIKSVHYYVVNERGSEIDEGNYTLSDCYKENDSGKVENAVSVIVHQEIVLGYTLMADKNYRDLMQQMANLLACDDFIKNKKSRYNELTRRLDAVIVQHSHRLFGKGIEYPIYTFPNFKQPYEVLFYAIQAAEEDAIDQNVSRNVEPTDIHEFADTILENVRNSGNQAEIRFWEDLIGNDINSMVFLPDFSQEDEISLLDNSIGKLNYVLEYPCCPDEKIYAYEGLSGKCALRCPKCAGFVIADFDNHTIARLRNIRFPDSWK